MISHIECQNRLLTHLIFSIQESDVDDDDLGTTSQHKKVLGNLKDTDPTFYKFLLENDKDLLNFEDSDPDSGDDAEKVHKPPELLQV
jgi:hypothetical protein